MMDYYSDFSPPPETDVINEITTILLSDDKYKGKDLVTVEKCVKKSLQKIGGYSSLGSLTGYIVFTKKELISNSQKLLNEMKHLKFKTVVHIFIALNSIYDLILHKRYKPCGPGYYEAEANFQDRVMKLPPIGSKNLNTPIKENVIL